MHKSEHLYSSILLLRVLKVIVITKSRLFRTVGLLAVGALISESVAAEPIVLDRTLVTLRFIERYIVAGAGVLLLYFGYRLFSSAQELGDLSAELPSQLKLKLTQVGPGVFFALFGTVLLIYVISAKVDVTAQDTGKVMLSGTLNMNQPDEVNVKRAIRAIELVRNVTITQIFPTSDDGKVELKDSLEVLRSLQKQQVDSLLGKGAFESFYFVVEQQKLYPNYRNNLPEELQKRISQVEDLIEGNEL